MYTLIDNGNVDLSICVLRLRKGSGHELLHILIDGIGGSGLPEGGGGEVVIGRVPSSGNSTTAAGAAVGGGREWVGARR